MKNENKYIEDYNKALNIAEEITEVMELREGDDTELKKWLTNEASSQTIDILRSEEELKSSIEHFNSFEESNAADNMTKLLQKRQYKNLNRHKLLKFAVTGITAAILAISMTILNRTATENSETIAYKTPNSNENIPVLLLSSGQRLELNYSDDVHEYESMSILNNKNTIKYSIKDRTAQQVITNKLIIPIGYTYNVILDDESEIIVNTNSTLEYPSQFNGETREVTLNGEAYFKIKKSDKPFIVNVKGIQIKVYGTEFNINAMENDVKTVLISGSVGVKFADSELKLSPGKMAVVNTENGEINESAVDVNYYTAWTRGMFEYNNEDISAMLKEIANWYGVKFIDLKQDLLNIKISGIFSRDESVDELIKILEIITDKKIVNEGGGQYTID